MGSNAPYMYSGISTESTSRFPASSFDPKAITRASWEPKPQKPKQDGPLLSFNRHPDAHMVLTHRSGIYTSMGSRTKGAITWLRRLQLGCRLLQLNAAIGVLVLMVLLTKVDNVTGWIMRITPGVVAAHCLYGLYHLSRDASGRAPGSSAAYQIFSAIADLATLSLYAFSAFCTHKGADQWGTRLDDQTLVGYFVPAVYYTLIGAGGLHLLSFCASLWLAWAFRKISLMPPDMNPLEAHLTARPRHKRNKSSMTTSSMTESEKRLSTPLEQRYRSGAPYESLSRPPSIPFMHTRAGSRTSLSSTREVDNHLPDRQYQITPGNNARNSAISISSKRTSRPKSDYGPLYVGLPNVEPSWRQGAETRSRDSIDEWPSTQTRTPLRSSGSRIYDQDKDPGAAGGRSAHNDYAALAQRYDNEDSEESDQENTPQGRVRRSEKDTVDDSHPDPLRLNPTLAGQIIANRAKTPYIPWQASVHSGNRHIKSLSEINMNPQRAGASGDIADEISIPKENSWRRTIASPSALDSEHYAKSYGQLRAATPPIMVGNDRKVSSGNDYDAKYTSTHHGRRNVSGKVVEEGRGGIRSSRFGAMNVR